MITVSSPLLVSPSLGPYNSDEYFAFVEAIDNWSASAKGRDGNDEKDPEWLMILLKKRVIQNLPPPEHAVWLDCVRAEYFAKLPWRDDPCEIGNDEQGKVRRKQILGLDPSQFRVALLLLSLKDLGGNAVAALNEALWHRVRLGKGELPIITAADYEFGANEPVQDTLQYERQCTNQELERLYNVFNFNFLPDADLGGLTEGGAPIIPPSPSGGWNRNITFGQAYGSQAKAQLGTGS